MNLDKFELIFFDFDGVIKESVSVKTSAFVELFQPYGADVCNKVRRHHIENGGMSRFNKIPLYLKWSNIVPTSTRVDSMCAKFSRIVKNKVINSAWVPGVEKFLRTNKEKYIFIMVSATPQEELKGICKSLKLDKFFSKFYGSPTTKSSSIKMSMDEYGIPPEACLMIGDAQTDIDAAKENDISFLFRRHQYNKNLLVDSDIEVIRDFNSYHFYE
jgi:phosphoglycolate phosphatase-like HAD superfamily hydrolase